MRQKLQLLFAVLAMAISASAENYILYTSSDGQVVTPSSTAHYGANITSNTYENGQGKIVFDGEVTYIGIEAFKGCMNLTSITIPNPVSVIDACAFDGCSGLESVEIPKSVTSIGDYAFAGCSHLTSLTVKNDTPANISLGSSVFEDVPTSTCTLYVPSGSKGLYAAAGQWSAFSKIIDDNQIIYYTSSDGQVVSLTRSDRFYENVVSNTYENGQGKIVFDGEVTAIGESAFQNCTSLTSVVIPNKVTSIGYRSFSGCTGLTSVTLPESLTSIITYAFIDCTSLTSVEIPESVKYIDAAAFQNCISLTSMTLPESLTEIGSNAFYGCTSLTSVTLPESLTSIGSGVFENCTSLTSVTLPESLTEIGNEAFSGCTNLKKIVSLNAEPPTAQTNTFSDVPSSCNVIVPDEAVEAYKAATGWSSLNIISASAPPSENQIIYYTSSDGQVVTPSSSDAFGATISSNTYADGKGMIVFDGEVTKIGNGAFSMCSNLTSVTLPESVTSIGSYAFSGCYALKEITSLSTTPPSVGSQCFDRVSVSSCVLRVPSASVEAYRTADVWRTFSIEAILESSMAIQDVEACRGTSFTLPIELMNQKTMSGLQFNLTLPEGVTVTGESTTERSEGKIVPAGNMDGNIYRHAARNEGADAIEVGEGAVLKLTLQVDETVELGDYTITLSDIILVAEDREEIKPSDMTATLTIKDYTLGDVNGNGEINVGDAVAIVNYVIKKPQETFIVEAADINDNGEINVGDAVAIVNYVIGKSDVLKAPRRGETADDNSISGFQCEISVTPGASIENISLGEGLAGNMALFWNRTGQYTYAVAALSMNGSSSHVNVEDLLMVTLSGNGTAVTDKLRFFDAAGNEMEVLGGEATGIAVINAQPTDEADVYDLAGRKVSHAAARKGIFIKNNKKVILK